MQIGATLEFVFTVEKYRSGRVQLRSGMVQLRSGRLQPRSGSCFGLLEDFAEVL